MSDPKATADAAAKTLKAMEASGLHLFPLRKWDATRVSPKTGLTERVGKMPRDVGYQLHDYRDFNWSNYLRRGGNVGAGAGPTDLIVDIDPDRGGLKSFERLCWDLDTDFSEYPRVMSGKGDGGFHVYMKRPEFLAHWQLKAFPGIDFQSFGRYVVAPGSLHPKTGKPYRLVRPWETPPEAPEGLLGLLRKPPRVSSHGEAGALSFDDVRSLLGALDAADFGQGGDHHDEWLNIAMAVHHGTGGDDEAKDIWLDWCATDSQYGDDAREMNERRWDSFDSSMLEAVTYKTLLLAVVRAGHAPLVARLHSTGAANDFDDDDLGEVMARVGVKASVRQKHKKRTRG
jgi:hypothetical protein